MTAKFDEARKRLQAFEEANADMLSFEKRLAAVKAEHSRLLAWFRAAARESAIETLNELGYPEETK